jgi:hypothetical protein
MTRRLVSDSLTACARMNFQRLGSGGSARILVIGNSNYPSRDFLRIYASYPETYFGYGNHEKGTGHKASWLLKDSVKDTSGFLIWKTYVWHHICFAYEKSSSKISFIKVKKLFIYGLNEMTKLYSNYKTYSSAYWNKYLVCDIKPQNHESSFSHFFPRNFLRLWRRKTFHWSKIEKKTVLDQ